MKEILQYRLTKTISWFLTAIASYQEARAVGVVVSCQCCECDAMTGSQRRRRRPLGRPGSPRSAGGTPLPEGRIAAAVKLDENDQGAAANPEADRVRKAPRDGAPYVAEYRREPLRRFGGFGKGALDFKYELVAKAGTLLFVPGGRILELRLSGASKDNSQRHRPIRERAAALSSSHP